MSRLKVDPNLTDKKIINSVKPPKELKKVAGRADSLAKKKEVLQALQAAWEKYPDLRLGQLLINVVGKDKLFYSEDQNILELLKKY